MTSSPRPRVGIILAAGKGTRMKSDLPKVLHPVLGKSMVQRVLESLIPLNLETVYLIVGHQAQRVEAHINSLELPFAVEFVVQEPQLGTGHALMQVVPRLPVMRDVDVLISCGDMPLIPTSRYQSLLEAYQSQGSVVTMAKVKLDNPAGYGRVVMKNGAFSKIVEEKDANTEEKLISWVNTGIYAAYWPRFSPYLSKLSQNNAQGEFYLTDALGLIAEQESAGSVGTVAWPEPDEVLGINSRHQLSEACAILSRWTAQRLMDEGVSLVNPCSMSLAPEIQVGPDTVLHPGCYLEGNVRIGAGCDIGPNTTMRGAITVGNQTRVIASYLDRAVTLGDNTFIGPYAHLRDNAVIGDTVKIGNFVEVKETSFGSRSNAAHLCYLGDAVIGEDVNMGAGSIVANYDPIRDTKHQTVIGDGVKIGCNSVLVAPVTLDQRSCVAAGSVITENVGEYDLAITRPRQTLIPRWVERVLNSLRVG